MVRSKNRTTYAIRSSEESSPSRSNSVLVILVSFFLSRPLEVWEESGIGRFLATVFFLQSLDVDRWYWRRKRSEEIKHKRVLLKAHCLILSLERIVQEEYEHEHLLANFLVACSIATFRRACSDTIHSFP